MLFVPPTCELQIRPLCACNLYGVAMFCSFGWSWLESVFTVMAANLLLAMRRCFVERLFGTDLVFWGGGLEPSSH